MSNPSRDHAAALLPDGRVLVVCGDLPTPEVYDPATGLFTPTSATTTNHGLFCTATRLQDGRVLVVGGWNSPQSAEVYDPATGTFSLTGQPTIGHLDHTATLLEDGRVLIVAGQRIVNGDRFTHAVTELYDPATGQFTGTGNLNVDRADHVAALLPSGKVLVAGGFQTTTPGNGIALRTAELYDPATGTFTPTSNMVAQRLGQWHGQAPVLFDGKVLVQGGAFATTAELYDEEASTFRLTAGEMTAPRGSSTVTLLATRRVLLAGGTEAGASAELYDPATESFQPVSNMAIARQQHSATLLADGRVLVVGGSNSTDANLSSAELFLPPPGAFHGASFLPGPAFAPESWVTLFGIQLAAAPVAAESVPLPTVLGDIMINVTDSLGAIRSAQLQYVNQNQINFLMPPDVAPGLARITVVRAGGTPYLTTLEVAPAAPGLFSANANGAGVAAGFAVRVRGDGSQVAEPLFIFNQGQGRYVTNPISQGPETESLYLVLFGTGLRGHPGLETVQLTVGGEPVPVQYAGDQLEFAGLDQLNAGPLPRSLSGVVDIALTVNGVAANVLSLELH